MIIKKRSLLTGKKNEMDLPVTPVQLDYWDKSKRLIQDIFPWLTVEQREFLISGVTPEEWNKYMKPPKE